MSTMSHSSEGDVTASNEQRYNSSHLTPTIPSWAQHVALNNYKRTPTVVLPEMSRSISSNLTRQFGSKRVRYILDQPKSKIRQEESSPEIQKLSASTESPGANNEPAKLFMEMLQYNNGSLPTNQDFEHYSSLFKVPVAHLKRWLASWLGERFDFDTLPSSTESSTSFLTIPQKYEDLEDKFDPSGELRQTLGDIVCFFGNALAERSKEWATQAFTIREPSLPNCLQGSKRVPRSNFSGEY
jgi:hypothetical protein